MQIERVNIEDVYPVEDEYGNQYLSRDYTLKENIRYVEELAASFGPNGEPDEPPVLVRDGGIFRIKAGNSRIEAMRLRKTKQFTAIIDEKDTPKALVEAAIRTDTKKRYEPIERSRFEQQLFLFDDDEYAAKVTGRPVEDVRKARRTMEVIKDASEDMTIERMIALADLEDDPEAYERVQNAKEGAWRSEVQAALARRAERERRAGLEAAIEERGLRLVGAVPEGYAHRNHTNHADGIPADLPEGAVFLPRYAGDAVDSGSIYVPTDKEVDAAAEELKAARAEHAAALERVKAGRVEWFLEHWSEDLVALSDIGDPADAFGVDVVRFCTDHALEMPWTPALNVQAFVAFNRCSPYREDWEHNPADFMAFADALEACGYEPGAEEREMYEECRNEIEEERSE